MPKTRAAAVGHLCLGGASLVAGIMLLLFADLTGRSQAGIPTAVLVIAVFGCAIMFTTLGVIALRRLLP